VKTSEPKTQRRAQVLFTRALALQWIQGDSSVAETSFFKINSQGTPLDETEEMLIKNRRKPIAISARAILRAGSGHKYWSAFNPQVSREIEEVAEEFHERIFKPEAREPLKTLELPLGGSVSPVDALALLVEFLGIAGSRESGGRTIQLHEDDAVGSETVMVLKNAFHVLNRMTGNGPSSLGLHPAVYFYNERGKYSRFMFLGMTSVIQEALRNNNHQFFRTFTRVRQQFEQFLIENKSLLGIILQNLSKGQRVPRIKLLFELLIDSLKSGNPPRTEELIASMGLRGRIVDVTAVQTAATISDDTKSMIYVRQAIESALRCPVCGGLLDPLKSVSYDHIVPVRHGGTGDPTNAQMAHPYCNTGYKEHLAAQ
jgi:hypothetical protein